MAKIGLTQGGYSLIPEGETILKIVSVDDSKLDDYGKLEITLADSKGRKHTERSNFNKSNGEKNDTAYWYFSTLARAALNLDEDDMSEIDPQVLVGKYIRVEVTHEEVESNTKPGTYNTFSRLGKERYYAKGFEEEAVKPTTASAPAAEPAKKKFDLNALLG